jgi:hypothetical protein
MIAIITSADRCIIIIPRTMVLAMPQATTDSPPSRRMLAHRYQV